ncbi:MAG: DUF4433 domain-containing protein [Defluviitaleaceae bacterium]|nr:DUF4433 domain-containing protein [Defluviitaleaceae bacterium]
MNVDIPKEIKIYHIVHISRLPSIIADGYLFSDSEIAAKPATGETIGMGAIKKRRLEELTISSHPGLYVGECVPFYFCHRSIMLYILHRANHADIDYRGGQEPIVHLVSDLHKAVEWADKNQLRWAFTDSNAGSRYFNDYSSLQDLDKIDWTAVHASQWSESHIREKKQAEFLIERHFPWELVEEIGTFSSSQQHQVYEIIQGIQHQPQVKTKKEWYY